MWQGEDGVACMTSRCKEEVFLILKVKESDHSMAAGERHAQWVMMQTRQ